jgi:hypothetical protein
MTFYDITNRSSFECLPIWVDTLVDRLSLSCRAQLWELLYVNASTSPDLRGLKARAPDVRNRKLPF